MIKILLFLTFVLIIDSAFGSFLPKEFSVDFEKSYKSTLNNKVRKSPGKMYYSYPGKMRFEDKGTEPMTVVLNRKKVWHFRPAFIPGEPGELTIESGGGNPVTFFFDTLRFGLNDNRFYAVSKKKDYFYLSFKKELKDRAHFVAAKLRFFGKKHDFDSISSIELIKESGSPITYKFKKVSRKGLSSSLFTFKAPKGTNINDRTKKKLSPK